MEETLIKLGLNVYQVSGIIGTLVFLISILVFLLITFYARRVKHQAIEIKAARDENIAMRERIAKQLEEALIDCENTCKLKDEALDKLRAINEDLRMHVSTYKNNETWFRNEIQNLEQELQEIRNELPKGRKRPRS